MAETRRVKLYYLGGFNGESRVVTAYGVAYTTPPAGEYLEVPIHVARRLIRRNRRPDGSSVFTTDANMAKLARNGTKVAPPIEPVVKPTREQLLKLLAELDEQEKVVTENEEKEVPAVKEKPAPKPRNTTPKTAKNKTAVTEGE